MHTAQDLKITALAMAVDFSKGREISAEKVVDAAKAFEKFLNSETSDAKPDVRKAA
jgi:hypothetical protein